MDKIESSITRQDRITQREKDLIQLEKAKEMDAKKELIKFRVDSKTIRLIPANKYRQLVNRL